MGTRVLHMDTTAAVSQALAARVRADIEASGKSILSLSNATGIPHVTLRRRVAGAPFSSMELISLAHALDIEASSWLADAERSVAAERAL